MFNNKQKHITFDSDNLAVPEVHIDNKQDDFDEDEYEDDEIDFENKAIPEIKIHKE